VNASMHLLWKDPPAFDSESTSLFFIDEISTETPKPTSLVLLKAMNSILECSRSADSVATSTSAVLVEFALQHLQVGLAKCSSLHEEASMGSLSNDQQLSASISSYSLPLYTLYVKVALSILMHSKPSSDYRFEKELSDLLTRTNSMLQSGLESEDAETVLTRTWQITQSLVEATSVGGYSLPEAVTLAAGSLCSTIQELLEGYKFDGDRDLASSSKPNISTVKDGFLSDDDEHDNGNDSEFQAAKKRCDNEAENSFGIVGQKRISQEISNMPKKHTRMVASGKNLSQQLAFLLASVLVSMDSSAEVCGMVVCALLGVESILYTEAADVDLVGGLYACQILCTESFLLQESDQHDVEMDQGRARENASPISLLCSILQILRASEVADVHLHSLCFQCCSSLMCIAECEQSGKSITAYEANLLVRILTEHTHGSSQASAWFSLRPQLRAIQVCAVTKSFKYGKQTFHSQFDREYPGFILPFLSDINGIVRRQASASIGAAGQLLPVHKIINSVRKWLPPLEADLPIEDAQRVFRKWLESKHDLSLTEDIPDASGDQIWEDAFLSIEFGVVDIWAMIACSTSSSEVHLNALFYFVKVCCSRPDKELLLYQVVDRIALSLGYEQAESLIEFLREGLLHAWLDNGKHSLLHLPLLLTGPSLLHYLVNMGKQFPLHSARLGVHGLHTGNIKAEITRGFIFKSTHFIIPLVLFHHVLNLPQSSVEEAGGSQLLHDMFMVDICSIHYNSYTLDGVKKIVESHLSDILAFQALLSHANESHQSASVKIDLLLEALLSKDLIQNQGECCVPASLRCLVDMCGKQLNQGKEHLDFSKMCSLGITSLIGLYGSLESNGGDLFGQIHSTASEYFIFANYKLVTNSVLSQIRKRFAPLDALCELIVQQLSCSQHKGLHVAFYIHVLCTLLLDEAMYAIHPLVASSISKLVQETVFQGRKFKELRKELSLIAKDLLCTCMHVHERCQQIYIASFHKLKDQSEAAKRRCLGFVGAHVQSCTSVGTMESAFLNYSDILDKDVAATLDATYDIIQILLENADDMELSSGVFVGIFPPYNVAGEDCELLKQVKVSFSAQNKVRDFLKHQNIAAPALAFVEDLSAGVRKGSRQLPVQQRIMQAELRELKKYLQSEPGQALGCQEVGKIVSALGILCGDPYDNEVCRASSWCLGEIAHQLLQLPENVLSENSAEIRLDEAAANIRHMDLISREMDMLFSKCAEDLLNILKGSGTNVSLIALDTLKAVVGCSQGNEWRKCIVDKEMARFLSSLLSSRQLHLHYTDLLLTDGEIKCLHKRAESFCGKCLDKNFWCWDKEVWKRGSLGHTSFKEWICCVVPAILVHCYPQPEEGSKEFVSLNRLSFCQRMSCVDSQFAASLFPAIIIDLLLEGHKNYENHRMLEIDGILQDTFIGHKDSEMNKNISTCFTALLQGFCSTPGSSSTSRPKHSEAALLALDTLDCLRRLTQCRFMASAQHGKKQGSMKSTEKGISVDQEKPPAWRGVPYGIVLQLDGLLVAGACLHAQKPASAIFYAEMYADSRFGRSSSIHEILHPAANAPCYDKCLGDISGFAAGQHMDHSSNNGQDLRSCLPAQSLEFFGLFLESFVLLGEEHAANALQKHIADLQFATNQMSLTLPGTLGGRQNPFHCMMELDQVSSQIGNSTGIRLSTVSCLHQLDLKNITMTYIRGLASDPAANFTTVESRELREKWFECSLGLMQWNDPIFLQSSDICDEARQASASKELLHMEEQDLSKLASSQAGVYEQMVGAMQALSQQDYESSLFKLGGARRSIISDLSSSVHPEMPLSALTAHAKKLEALNQLESILESKCPLKETLKVHTFYASEGKTRSEIPLSTRKLPVLRSHNEFGECLTELTLRSMYTKARRHSQEQEASLLLDRLIVHLWNTSLINFIHCNCQSASGALSRLGSLLPLSAVINNDFISLLSIRLQEARVLELRGDFTRAIHQAAQIASCLHGETPGTERDSMLSEALVTCGHWKARHKVEPAHSVLQTYLAPGAHFAKLVFDKQKNADSTGLATSALLELAQLASSLFDAVTSRVRSAEWQKGGQILLEQESELCQIVKDIKELEMICSRAKAKSKQHRAALTKLSAYEHYRITLEREIDTAKCERNKIESSIKEYCLYSFQSTISALSIAGENAVEDRHVFQMVSLWFASQGTDQQDAANLLMAEAVQAIPSFRFVPLATQLFSRLGQESQSAGRLHKVLRCLLLKMCLEHPYHCLIHLVYVSNAKHVGAGVTGHNVPAYLENSSSSSKVAESQKLIKQLQQLQDDDGFTQNLLQSYQALADAYIYLAMLPVDACPPGESVPFAKIGKSKADRLDQCLGFGSKGQVTMPCVLTKPPPISPSGDYNLGNELGLVGSEIITGFNKSFKVSESGKSKPKIVSCTGSHGNSFKQLVKGNDEVRQDAVMEQVFGFVNQLFSQQTERGAFAQGTRAFRNEGQSLTNNLRVMTYKIVPLSPTTGVCMAE